MTFDRAKARAALRRALVRGAEIQNYEVRAYQLTAAVKCAEALLGGRNAVLTLPTGTGKTLICGMASALFLTASPDERVLFTAPRKTLLSQLRERSLWLGPTASTGLVGIDARDSDQRVRAAFEYSKVLFGMPEFLANRLQSGAVDAHAIERIKLLVIDEFDAFLTLRYLARGVSAAFHEPLELLRSKLSIECRVLLVSATTPEIASAGETASTEQQVDASAHAAFRRFLDVRLRPIYVSVPERYYSTFVPHARIHAIAVTDPNVKKVASAVEQEVALLLNWISGTVRFHIESSYVLPRLSQIRAGKLALWPKGPRVSQSSPVSGLLGRLEKMVHLPDFLYEDMAKDVTTKREETWKYTADFEGKYSVAVDRIVAPATTLDGAMLAGPRAKLEVVEDIARLRLGQRGILFLRNIRILEVAAELLRKMDLEILTVHGDRSTEDNNASLARFRTTSNCLLLITRDTGKRGLDLPEGDYAIFYSPKSRDDVTWQEVSRIRSTIGNPKATYMLFYEGTGEEEKMAAMATALVASSRSTEVQFLDPNNLSQTLAILAD
ncbi:DEAD/DEAH box helicase [Roseomonas sp. AR75]|uniref:DEAD/DEAH box helicase n=1 Tax=Roseomonas sp. AR75 TaxID=2562311 RepID=UPI0010C0A8F3|nr:DEAD/DEAH box helicase [Roseomonas sp. AR75]